MNTYVRGGKWVDSLNYWLSMSCRTVCRCRWTVYL